MRTPKHFFARRWPVALLLALLSLTPPGCGREDAKAPPADAGGPGAVLAKLPSPVHSVAVTPDGRTLAAGCHDGTIRLWELATGRPGAPLRGHQGVVAALLFTPDGKTLISAGHDRAVTLWDVATGAERRTLRGHRAAVWALALARDGRRLASAGPYDERGRPLPGDVRLWDLPSGKEEALGDLPQKNYGVTSVVFTPDGGALVLASTDGSVKLWGLAEGLPRATFPDHLECVWCVALTADGKTLASGAAFGRVKLWDVAAAKERHTLQAGREPVSGVAFSADGGTLATVSRDGVTRLWDVPTGAQRAALRDRNNPSACAVFTADGKTLICGLGHYGQAEEPLAGGVQIWDLSRVLPQGR
jgi:WD40 repeat protein